MKILADDVFLFDSYDGDDLAMIKDKFGHYLASVRCDTRTDGTRNHQYVNAILQAFSVARTLAELIRAARKTLEAFGCQDSLMKALRDGESMIARIKQENPTVQPSVGPESGYPSPELAEDYSI